MSHFDAEPPSRPGTSPTPAPGWRTVDEASEAAARYQALTEGILALGTVGTEGDLFRALLVHSRAIYPATHWAIGEMVDPDSEAREVIIRAESETLQVGFGRPVLGVRFPVMGRGFSIQVYDEQRPAFVADALREPEGIHPDFVQRFRVQSLLGIPLLFDGRSVGGMFAVAFQGEAPLQDQPGAFDALLTLARVGAMALHRLRAQQALRDQLARVSRLNAQLGSFQEVTSELAMQQDVGLAMILVLRMAQEATDLAHLELFRLADDEGSLRQLASLGHPLEAFVPRLSLPLVGPESGLPGLAMATGERLVLAGDLDPAHRGLGARSGAAFLIRGQSGDVLGVLAAYCEGPEGLPAERLARLGPFVALAGLALERNRLWVRLQAELQERMASEERYRQLFHHSVEPILIGTRAGYIMANEAAQALLGRPLQDLVGKPAGFFSPPFQPDGRSSIEAGRAYMAEAFEGKVVRFEWLAERPDGSRVETEATVALIPGDGEPLFQVILRDLTEIKKAHREKESLERQLFHAQKLESLGVLAGGIAHDFNNLLMGVMGHAGLALEPDVALPDVRHHLEAIQKAGQRAADLTRQLLAYSGRGRFLIEPVDLSRLVEELLPLVEVSIPKSVALDLRLGEGLPLILADSSQLQQVVLNLVLNAAEAIGEGGGRIFLTTTLQTLQAADLSRFVEGQSMDRGPVLVLEVADTGTGMDAATLHRIFEPFFTTKFTGRGLGLSAILGIVRGHQGGLEVMSELGQGTAFRVYLPVASEVSAPVEEPASPPAAAPAIRRRVLVVDDDEAVRIVASQILSARGFEVACAVDGVEALEMVAARPDAFHLVLLDMTMPRMGGVEVLGRLREDHPGLRVILTSGFSEDDVSRGLHEHHPDGFLQKPYRPRDLTSLADRILEAP